MALFLWKYIAVGYVTCLSYQKKLPYRLIHWKLALTDLHSAAPSIDTNLQGPSIALTNKYRHFFMLIFLLFASKVKFTLHRQTQCRQSPDYTMPLPILIQHVQLVKTRSDRLLRVTSNKTSRSETLKKCLLPFVAQCELALKVFLVFLLSYISIQKHSNV